MKFELSFRDLWLHTVVTIGATSLTYKKMMYGSKKVTLLCQQAS